MATVHYVSALPVCDFCSAEAKYDAVTRYGFWAYLCPFHYRKHTNGRLGTGVGQRLEVADKEVVLAQFEKRE